MATSAHDLPRVPEYDAVVYEATGKLKSRQQRSRAELMTQIPRGVLERLGDPSVLIGLDGYWRFEAEGVWTAAIFGRWPAMRDYYDYLTAYVEPASIRLPAWRAMWMQEISGDAVPRIKLSNLAAFLQLSARITAGNAGDLNHVSFLVGNDRFLTCDQALYQVLTQLVAHGSRLARPVLTDCGASSASEAPVVPFAATVRPMRPDAFARQRLDSLA